ncbi:MFS transporter [Actinophytocola sediminis]
MTVAAPAVGLWNRNFSLFFVARAVARLGDMMLPIALAAGLVQFGHGVGAVGAAMASFSACFAGFVIFGGVIADRVDTRKLMVAADAVRVGTQGLVATMFFTGHVVLWQICAIGMVNGLCAALFQPGVASTIPRIAGDVQGANGAIRIAESVMSIAGPAFAGLLIGLTSVGDVFVAHAMTYLVSGGCLLAVRLPAGSSRTAPSTFRRDLRVGWHEFWARTWMWGVIIVWMLAQITAFGPTAPLVATVIVVDHGETAFGVVSGVGGLGMVVGGLLAMRLRPVRPLRAGAIALFGFSLQPVSVGLDLPVPVLAIAFAVAGGGGAFWGVMWSTSVQTQVPPGVLNRIHAYEVAGSLAMLPVGQALAGPASGLLGAPTVLLTSGVLGICCVTALVSVPAIRNLRRVRDGPVGA